MGPDKKKNTTVVCFTKTDIITSRRGYRKYRRIKESRGKVSGYREIVSTEAPWGVGRKPETRNRHQFKNMKPIEFAEQNVIYAKSQPEYLPLPAYQFPDGAVFCWSLNPWERLKVLFTGRIWHQVLTFGKPLQPQLLGVHKPEIKQ